MIGCRQNMACISEYRALQFSENGKRVFDVKHSVEFSTDGMAVIIVRAKIAFAETEHGRGSAVEKTFIDRNSGRFLRDVCRERMKDDNPRDKGDEDLPEPARKRGQCGLS